MKIQDNDKEFLTKTLKDVETILDGMIHDGKAALMVMKSDVTFKRRQGSTEIINKSMKELEDFAKVNDRVEKAQKILEESS